MENIKTWILALSLGIFVACGCSSGTDTGSTTSSTTSTTGDKPGASVSLTGAGSTFVNPAMSKWAEAYKGVAKDVSINYQSVGSGAGISQLKAGTVDFACSDVPLDDKGLKEMPSEIVQVPVTAGCVVVGYNLAGNAGNLQLSGDVIADIFLGKITMWNDARIAGQNAGVTLPATKITVAHRSDGSGTTYIFTDYLSSVSPDWKAGPGKNKQPKWPTGVGGKGNDGVAGLIKQTDGTIGYVELAYATQTKMTFATIKNKSGAYVKASADSTSAAANAAVDALKTDIRTSIVDTADAKGYPICGFTYAMMSKAPTDAAKGKAVLDFLTWVLNSGQDMAKDLQYAPLPKSVVELDTTALGEVKTK